MTRAYKLLALAILCLAPFVPGSAVRAQGSGGETIIDCEGCPEFVTLPDGTAIGKYLVTRDQFAVFAEDTDYEGKPCTVSDGELWGDDETADWMNPKFEQAGDHPVVCVTWLDATAYAEWLSERTGQLYRLPTFEESAAAAGGGSTGPYFWGEGTDAICQYANVADASYAKAVPKAQYSLPCDDGHAYTSPVTAFPPNAYGLHDAVGNVWQWTNSCVKGDCANAVFRGGGWNVAGTDMWRLDANFGDRILLRNFVIGFRLLREPS